MALRIVVAIAIAVVAWLLLTYNRLVRLRQFCRESWATVDTELKRRHDLIPNLVAAVQSYAQHEAAALTAATAARHAAAAATPREVAAHEEPLVTGTQRLLAIAESNPQLKASTNFFALQADLADTEDRIQAARRLYNANVRELNSLLQTVPITVVAGAMGFAAAEFFELDRAVIHQVVDVSFRET